MIFSYQGLISSQWLGCNKLLNRGIKSWRKCRKIIGKKERLRKIYQGRVKSWPKKIKKMTLKWLSLLLRSNYWRKLEINIRKNWLKLNRKAKKMRKNWNMKNPKLNSFKNRSRNLNMRIKLWKMKRTDIKYQNRLGAKTRKESKCSPEVKQKKRTKKFQKTSLLQGKIWKKSEMPGQELKNRLKY